MENTESAENGKRKRKKKRGVDAQRTVLVTWVGLLSLIVLIVAIVVNTQMGKDSFRDEMMEHSPPPVSDANSLLLKPTTSTPGLPLGAPGNLIGAPTAVVGNTQAIDNVTVDLKGIRVTNGVSEKVTGSGVVVGAQHILTSYHVVEKIKDLRIVTRGPNIASYGASVVRVDWDNDLALLEVAADARLSKACLGDSNQINPGDKLFAVGIDPGAPKSVLLSGAVFDRNQCFNTAGRAYHRMIRAGTYSLPGPSGGPLVNGRGEVVAINTAVFSPAGEFTGVRLATPINRAKRLLANKTPAGMGRANVPALSGRNYFEGYALAA